MVAGVWTPVWSQAQAVVPLVADWKDRAVFRCRVFWRWGEGASEETFWPMLFVFGAWEVRPVLASVVRLLVWLVVQELFAWGRDLVMSPSSLVWSFARPTELLQVL